MNGWRKPCEDGNFFECLANDWCEGGSPVTAADLEALGEKVWFCTLHDSVANTYETRRCRGHWLVEQISDIKPSPCRMVERLLIPIPDPQPATEWGPDHPSYDEMGQ